MAREPAPHLGTLVGTQVVQDQVQRLVARCRALQPPEELHEFLTPVTAAAFTDHDAVEHAQRGIQRGRPVADVVMRLAFGDAGPQGQHRARPVQRLDPTLLIDAKHHGFGGWIQIQPHHVAHLLDEVGIGRQLELPHAVGLEAVLSPDLTNRAVAYALPCRQGAITPMGAGRRACRQGRVDDRLHLRWSQAGAPAWTRGVAEHARATTIGEARCASIHTIRARRATFCVVVPRSATWTNWARSVGDA